MYTKNCRGQISNANRFIDTRGNYYKIKLYTVYLDLHIQSLPIVKLQFRDKILSRESYLFIFFILFLFNFTCSELPTVALLHNNRQTNPMFS